MTRPFYADEVLSETLERTLDRDGRYWLDVYYEFDIYKRFRDVPIGISLERIEIQVEE